MRPAIMGPLGPAQLACLRSWNSSGWRPLFIQIGERKASSSIPVASADYLHLAEDVEADRQISLLLDFLRQYEAVGLTCLSYDSMVWLHGITHTLPPTVSLLVADPAVLDVLRSKTVQLEVATEVGLPILPSFLIGTRFQQSVKPEHFPLVLAMSSLIRDKI